MINDWLPNIWQFFSSTAGTYAVMGSGLLLGAWQLRRQAKQVHYNHPALINSGKRSYTEDRFGTGPIWHWGYSEVPGDLIPLNISPYCPQCKNAMTILGKQVSEVREDGYHLYRVEMQCKNHPVDKYWDIGNFDGSDYPEIRRHIGNRQSEL